MQPARDRRRFRFSYAFLAQATLVILLVYGLINAAWLARDIVFIGFLAMLFASFLSIFVDRLDDRIPRVAATLVVFLGWLGLIVAFFFLIWPQLENQLALVREEVPRIIQEVTGWIEDRYRSIVGPIEAAGGEVVAGGEEVPTAAPEGEGRRFESEATSIIMGALPLLNTVIGAFTGVLVVLFAGVFITVNPRTYRDGMLSMVPERGRAELARAIDESAVVLRRWIGGMSVSMAVIFVLTTAGLWILGVPAYLALGVIAGLLVFIPFVGPILAAVPAMALGLTVSPLMALWVALLYFGIQQVESNALTPLIMKRAIALPPAVILLFQMAMAVLFGFIGILVAVPLLAALRVFVLRLYIDRLAAEGSEAA